jgi:hypothetical protein
MKKIMFLGVMLGAMLSANAQTWEEWFRQKETQKKYLLEQIAALKVYLGYARKGYEIAGKGWRIIQGIKEGDLNLHSEFFASFSKVNPQIKASPCVAGIITLQSRILWRIKETRNHVGASGQFTASEKAYFQKVLDGLLQESVDSLEELLLLTTSDALELSDDERINRIETLYEAVQDMYTFISSFGAEIDLLSAQRMREQVDIQHSKRTKGLR